MGLFGKKVYENIPAMSVNDVKQRLLTLNRDTEPYRIIDGGSEKQT